MFIDRAGAKANQAFNVHVQTARTDVVPTWQGHVSNPAAGQQRAEYADRRPHTPDQVVVGAVFEHRRNIDDDELGLTVMRH